MGILLVYDVTDERSFNSEHLTPLLWRIAQTILTRYPHVARQHRTARLRRREQDPYW